MNVDGVLGIQGLDVEIAKGLLLGQIFEDAAGGEDGLFAGHGHGLVGDDILVGDHFCLHGDLAIAGAVFPDLVALAVCLVGVGQAVVIDWMRLGGPIVAVIVLGFFNSFTHPVIGSFCDWGYPCFRLIPIIYCFCIYYFDSRFDYVVSIS